MTVRRFLFFCTVLAAAILSSNLGFCGPPVAHDEVTQPRVDYLLALNLAAEGSKPEALHLLAESLRLQPENNPAASLVFELLTELCTNSNLRLRGHTGGILYAAYSPEGSKIVTASEDHTARIWDARTGKQLGPALQHEDDVHMAEFSADGTQVVTASEDGTACRWDAATGQPIGAPMKENQGINFARFSPDGKLVATGADEGLGRIWNAATGEQTAKLGHYHGSVFQVNFSPDGSRIVVATADAKADVLEAGTYHPLFSLKHGNNVFTAVFSPDGTRILTASGDGAARIWDAHTGQLSDPVFQHGFWLWSAAFNRDASRVVTASEDHTARVWNAATGKPITGPLQHADGVVGAVFSPDGALVATASRDHTARVWDAVTGRPLTLGLRTADEVTGVVFNRHGDSLLVISKDRVAQVWDMPPRGTPPPWLADLAEFASTQTRYNASRQPDLAAMQELSTRLLAARSDDPWERFGRWYFTQTDVRPISPWSTVSLQEYVDGLIASGDKDSIDYAISLSRKVPDWMLKLIPMQQKLNEPIPATPSPTRADD